jgi:mannonate dehydratase
MRRRDLARTLVGGSIGSSIADSFTLAASAQVLAPRKNTLMHVGGDYHAVAGPHITAKENLEYNLRHGVKHLTVQMRNRGDEGWDLAELKKMKAACDEYGITLEAIRMDADYIGLRTRPERDRELRKIVGNIQKASEAGVRIITYHWTVIPIRRNKQTLGRGKATYAGFKLEDNWEDLPTGKSGEVKSEDYWERISYFLEKVIPVARQYGVRFACHPYDPPGLPFGYQGAENWDSPSIFDSIKRYTAIIDDPHNGFQLCLGTTGEGLKNSRTEVLPIVRYLGERGRIYQIHMRNIRGGLHDFDEVYPDEGEMDFFQIMRILRDVQFSGAICPDHMPRHPDDPGGLQAFAFGSGYIKALIQAVNSEVG